MIRKRAKPPVTQRSFPNIWGELDYLCKKIHYWLYIRKQRARADRYLGRLQRVLHELPANDLAIIRQEGLALLHELKGETAEAMVHRRREIELMERLHTEAQSRTIADSTKAYMLRGRETHVLEERRAILEGLRNAKAGSNGDAIRGAVSCRARRA